MKKHSLLFCLFLFGYMLGALQAQQAISSLGGEALGTGGTVSYSVGLPAYSTITGAGGSVAAGIQEPYLRKLMITNPPDEFGLTCNDNLPVAATTAAELIAIGGTVSNKCIALNDLTVESIMSTNNKSLCPWDGPLIATRTYKVIDACGNMGTSQQTFTYEDSDQGPVITSIAPTCYNCNSIYPSPADITYTVDCDFGSTVMITGPEVSASSTNCPGMTYTYTYTVIDECGRTASAQRAFFIGNVGPTITCPTYNLILDCGDPNNDMYIATHLSQVSAYGGCGFGVTLTNNYTGLDFKSCNNSTQVVVFTAEDACGCKSNCITTITLQDNSAPVLTSTYVDGICNEAICSPNVNYWFKAWMDKVEEGLSATDNCSGSGLTWSTNPAIPTPKQDCPSGLTETEVTWIAADDCGNFSDISYSFFVTPATGNNALGMVQTEPVEAVVGVEPNLADDSDLLEIFTTENDEVYSFDEAPFVLMQNRPNPFSVQTIIGFVLPEETIATLAIYEVTGKQLKQITRNYEAGYHEVLLDRNDFNTGVMYYHLVTSTHKATKKMIHKQ